MYILVFDQVNYLVYSFLLYILLFKLFMNNLSVIILAVSLIIIMWGMGLSLVVDDFKRVLSYPKAIIIGLTNQLIVLPLIGFGLASVFSVSPEIAIGVMILSACPGGPTSNLIAHLAKGDTALSVSLTAMSSLISILTIPFVINFALVSFIQEGQIIQLNIAATILQIFAIVIIPVSIGMFIRYKSPSFSDKMEKPVRIASAVVLGLVIVGIILKERANMGSYFEQAGLIALSLNLLSMTIGFLSARLLKISKAQSISISIESGIQNGTMAIMISTTLLSNTAFAVAPAIYSILMFFTGGVVIFFAGRSSFKKVNEVSV